MGKIIIVFDGFCVLCNKYVAWLAKKDVNKSVRFTDFNSNFIKENYPSLKLGNTLYVISDDQQVLEKSKCTFEIDWTLNAQPYLTQKTEMLSIVQKALCKINGQEARIDNGGGTSDGRWVAPSGSEVIELGPRNQTIHQIDEKISLKDLEQLQEIYQQILVETNNQLSL